MSSKSATRVRVAFRVPTALWADAQVVAASEGTAVTALVERAMRGEPATPGLPRVMATASAVALGRTTGTQLVGVRLPPLVVAELDRRAADGRTTRTAVLCDALAVAVMGEPAEVADALSRLRDEA